jgi:hypothetical protein
MIPAEVGEIATLIWIGWADLPDEDEAQKEILAAAWRIYASGYRKQAALTQDK